ncbi:hypothetical protein RGCCGE502_26872 (plasmid) [Rhizobium grahamii CCGE 502]|uniref:Uncharacterized protein n=1 Tax=Rhizobium grahamii CCGE 502 TaxID=990285 RepID=S3I6F4_9HYPH|nr:hypothetical protein RGCCGE502_26872 [Rhizobium grahamii CCGE 502]
MDVEAKPMAGAVRETGEAVVRTEAMPGKDGARRSIKVFAGSIPLRSVKDSLLDRRARMCVSDRSDSRQCGSRCRRQFIHLQHRVVRLPPHWPMERTASSFSRRVTLFSSIPAADLPVAPILRQSVQAMPRGTHIIRRRPRPLPFKNQALI